MNSPFECEQTLLVQAEFDGELDAARAAALLKHREDCAECQAVQEKLARARALMRAAPRFAGSPELRERLGLAVAGSSEGVRAMDGSSPRSASGAGRYGWRWSTGWAAAAAVAVVAIILSISQHSTDIGLQLVNNHVRAMQLDTHLVDVVSTDHHTVKPWFAGKVDFAPPVKQLDNVGYVLKGGRIDVVNARTAAVLVYQAGRHTVEVFIWPERPESGASQAQQQLEGFNLRRWQEGGFEVWAISDMGAEELDTFASRWRAASK